MSLQRDTRQLASFNTVVGNATLDVCQVPAGKAWHCLFFSVIGVVLGGSGGGVQSGGTTSTDDGTHILHLAAPGDELHLEDMVFPAGEIIKVTGNAGGDRIDVMICGIEHNAG